MKTSLMFVAVLSLAAAGCKQKAAEGNTCRNAISNSMALSKAEMAKLPDMDAKMMQKMADLGVLHCKEDKWSADAIKCMTDAKTMTDAQGCYGKLTPAQQEGMNKAAMDLAMGDQQRRVDRVGPPGDGSAGSAGSGSDGAPGAGSAAGSAAAAATGNGSSGSAAAPK